MQNISDTDTAWAKFQNVPYTGKQWERIAMDSRFLAAVEAKDAFRAQEIATERTCGVAQTPKRATKLKQLNRIKRQLDADAREFGFETEPTIKFRDWWPHWKAAQVGK
jgi:hypothetical protein